MESSSRTRIRKRRCTTITTSSSSRSNGTKPKQLSTTVEEDDIIVFHEDDDFDLKNNNNSTEEQENSSSHDDESKPKLRRAGSSTLTELYENDFSEGDDDDDETKGIDIRNQPITYYDDDQNNKNTGISGHILNTCLHQFKGLTEDFQKSGLPWDGYQCRSILAGGSGIMYALPSLLVTSLDYTEKIMWIVQAVLSVLADYVHIHHDSIWHGIDRYFATFNTLATLYRATRMLNPYFCLGCLMLPLGSYVAANRAKNAKKLIQWQYCHLAWHVTGSLLVLVIVYLIKHCPDITSNNDNDEANPRYYYKAACYGS